MKKLFLSVVLILFCTTKAYSFPWHSRPHHKMPHPANVIINHHHNNHRLESFFAELAGSAIGSYIATTQYQPAAHTKARCITMRSRLTGNVVRRCLKTSNIANRQQQEIYDVLYIE